MREMSGGPFQNLIASGTRSLVRIRNQEKHLRQVGISLLHQDHPLAKRCSRSQRCVKPGLLARAGEKRMLKKPFFDPAVCEITAMILDLNL